MARFLQPFLWCLTAVLALAGCRKMPINSGMLESTTPKSKLSSNKLRTLLGDYVPRFADQVEEAADRILAESTDAEIQRNALLWKSNAISACFQAATRPDPLAAFLDVWILDRQMTQLFEQPMEHPHFGEWQGLAIQTSRQLEQPLRVIQTQLGTGLLPGGHGVALGEEFVTTFAQDNPVRSLYFDRPSLAAPYIQQVDQQAPEVLQVVDNLNEDLTEFQRLSARYSEFLPKLSRWQAELLLLSQASSGAMAKPLQNLTVISQAMDRLATTADRLATTADHLAAAASMSPAILERERSALRAIVAEERTEILRDMERMRGETLEQLTTERVAVLNALRDERVQVARIVSEVTDSSLRRVDQMVDKRAAGLSQSGQRLMDRAWHRAWQVAMCLGLVFLLTWCFRFLTRRRGGPEPLVDRTLADSRRAA